MIRPQAGPQELFLSTPADIAIYGGAAGGGKTWGLLIEPLRHVTTVKDYGAVIFRRTSKQVKNEGGMWDESYKLYPHVGAVPKEGSLAWLFPPYENQVRFSHMEHEKNRFDWQGAQIPFIGFDELTHFTEEMFFYMLSRNRTTCGVVPYVRATTNPDADSWVAALIAWWIDQDTGLPIPARSGAVRWFIRVDQGLIWADRPADLARYIPAVAPGDETHVIQPKSLTFIPANVHDNAILMARDPQYLSNLYALPPVERARLLGGNWKIRPASGLILNRGWFRILERAPADPLARVRYWDKAGTTGGGKRTAGVLMARHADGRYVIEDVVKGHWAAAERNRVIRQVARADGVTVDIYLEQEPGSGGKESAEISIRELAGYSVHADRPTGDKVARADPLSAQAEAGNVYLVHGSWNKDYLAEADAFPESSYTDQVDASSGAFNKLANMTLVDDFDEDAELGGAIPESEIGGRIF